MLHYFYVKTHDVWALEPRPQQMRESWSCVYVHLHSFFNLSLTHSTHSPQKELRYWYFVKAFDLSLLSIFLLHHYWLPLFRRAPFDLFRHHQLRIFYFRNVVPRHVLNVLNVQNEIWFYVRCFRKNVNSLNCVTSNIAITQWFLIVIFNYLEQTWKWT